MVKLGPKTFASPQCPQDRPCILNFQMRTQAQRRAAEGRQDGWIDRWMDDGLIGGWTDNGWTMSG